MNQNPEFFYFGLCVFMAVVIVMLLWAAFSRRPRAAIDPDRPGGPYIKDGLLYVPCSVCGRAGMYPLRYDGPIKPIRCFACWKEHTKSGDTIQIVNKTPRP